MKSEETLDIVDRNDRVIGRATRSDVYAKKLLHRIAHILIFNSEGEMLLQLRSKKSSFCPGHWSTAVGGHVVSGESYEVAARREFKEELGDDAPFQFIAKDYYEDNVVETGIKKFLSTFKTVLDKEFKVNPDEVQRVEYFSLEKIQEMINEGEKFHPELLFLLEKYFNIKQK